FPARAALSANSTWALPIVVFSAWQLAVFLRTGRLPMSSSTGNNVGAPFSGLVDGMVHYVRLFPHKAALEWGWECAVLIFFGTLAAISLRTSTALLHERIAWAFSLVFIVLLSSSVWLGDVGFRSLDDFYLLSCVLVLFSRVRLNPAGWLVALTWSAVAVELILLI
ncbi:MAG TPA: hypothetical protein VEJ84_16525, partial [Acidimicrobiales bacterium]|nr:hypothetical protein [Acidimicrobiales bacterium]